MAECDCTLLKEESGEEGTMQRGRLSFAERAKVFQITSLKMMW